MNRLLISLVLVVMMLASACKKDKLIVGHQPPENNEPEWQLFTTANSKLPDNQVNAIAIGADNTKWIGTSKGLVRIVGGDWTFFRTRKFPAARFLCAGTPRRIKWKGLGRH